MNAVQSATRHSAQWLYLIAVCWTVCACISICVWGPIYFLLKSKRSSRAIRNPTEFLSSGLGPPVCVCWLGPPLGPQTHTNLLQGNGQFGCHQRLEKLFWLSVKGSKNWFHLMCLYPKCTVSYFCGEHTWNTPILSHPKERFPQPKYTFTIMILSQKVTQVCFVADNNGSIVHLGLKRTRGGCVEAICPLPSPSHRLAVQGLGPLFFAQGCQLMVAGNEPTCQ